MKKTILILIIVAIQWPFTAAHAGTIYSWEGKDGNLRFSGEPPPEGITEYQTIATEAVDEYGPKPENRRRPSYDSMVQEALREADRSRAERQEREAALAAEKARIAEEKRQARIQAEQKRLEQQIQTIKARAVSPTFPNGMKQAQIEALREELENLGGSVESIGTTNDNPDENTEERSDRY